MTTTIDQPTQIRFAAGEVAQRVKHIGTKVVRIVWR